MISAPDHTILTDEPVTDKYRWDEYPSISYNERYQVHNGPRIRPLNSFLSTMNRLSLITLTTVVLFSFIITAVAAALINWQTECAQPQGMSFWRVLAQSLRHLMGFG